MKKCIMHKIVALLGIIMFDSLRKIMIKSREGNRISK